jgi:hypothetical protein
MVLVTLYKYLSISFKVLMTPEEHANSPCCILVRWRNVKMVLVILNITPLYYS